LREGGEGGDGGGSVRTDDATIALPGALPGAPPALPAAPAAPAAPATVPALGTVDPGLADPEGGIPAVELLTFAIPHQQERMRPTGDSSNVVHTVGYVCAVYI